MSSGVTVSCGALPRLAAGLLVGVGHERVEPGEDQRSLVGHAPGAAGPRPARAPPGRRARRAACAGRRCAVPPVAGPRSRRSRPGPPAAHRWRRPPARRARSAPGRAAGPHRRASAEVRREGRERRRSHRGARRPRRRRAPPRTTAARRRARRRRPRRRTRSGSRPRTPRCSAPGRGGQMVGGDVEERPPGRRRSAASHAGTLDGPGKRVNSFSARAVPSIDFGP